MRGWEIPVLHLWRTIRSTGVARFLLAILSQSLNISQAVKKG